MSAGPGDRPGAGFGGRLAAAMEAHGPVCVGIDPHPALLSGWGLPDTADGLRRFGLAVVDALAGAAAAVKPQSAFFERHGSAGVAALEEVLAAARDQGVLTVLDVKRGDIGSTMQGYADAYLRDGAPLAADAVTLSPYLGLGSLQPALDTAEATGRGVFVLALTSNPEGRGVQHAVAPGGRAVAAEVAAGAARANSAAVQRGEPMGPVGLVVGATVGSAVADLGVDLAGLGGPVLAPGVGAQGAGAAELRAVFGGARGRVLASTSRGVLGRGPRPEALRAAHARAVEEVVAALRT
ncbi:orotidine-5'-phosphate decarboxylase [Georgenia sp. 10Sc9-8]|uniref:Orotidine 5'-phosphate decarboxylase n=1 Tax=Georgenia halotolerans TaxID=3028317 RepID=A0ABT5TWJ8_9MICO|nr:orotidine-5'-phosphate decarboxylase [Georgenia halotolerans]